MWRYPLTASLAIRKEREMSARVHAGGVQAMSHLAGWRLPNNSSDQTLKGKDHLVVAVRRSTLWLEYHTPG
jgi:hypothetical protein